MSSHLHSNRYFDPLMYYKDGRRNSSHIPYRYDCQRARRCGRPNPENYDRYSYATNFKPPWKRKNFRIGKHLYIYNINRSVDVRNLKNMFRSVGPLKYFSVHYDKRGRISGTGEVCYEALSSVYQALARFQSFDINGRHLDIRALSE